MHTMEREARFISQILSEFTVRDFQSVLRICT